MIDTIDSRILSAPYLAGTIDELLRLVGDGAKGCSNKAIEAFCAMNFEKVAPCLEKAVRNDGDADLRNGAMDVMVRFGARAVPLLIELLDDANEEVRNFSAVMLGNIGRNEAVPALCRALDDAEPNVRHGAAEALGKIYDRRALLPLVGLLRGDCWDRFFAVSALGNLGDARAIPYLLDIADDQEAKEVVVEALSRLCGSPGGATISSIIDEFVEDAQRYKAGAELRSAEGKRPEAG